MVSIKPSDKEEEYFAKKEYERLKALAAKQAQKEQEEERQMRKELHYMHCPKCGGDLVEIAFREIKADTCATCETIKIDKCTMCEGIWLDAGELDQILDEEDTTLIKRILKAFK
jgi:Zn-finger nucleic acid-binding protein